METMNTAFFKSAAGLAVPTEQVVPEFGKKMVTVFRTQDFKATDPDDAHPGGTLEGYASIFGNVDYGGDIVERGAFAESVPKRLMQNDLKLVDSHKIYSGTSAIIGKVHECYEDAKGLFFKAFFSSVASAQEVRTKIKEGILDAISFGYYIEDMSEEMKDGERIWRLKKLDVFEISVVGWGMNGLARVTGAKSGSAAPADPPLVKTASDQELDNLIAGLRQVQTEYACAKIISDLRACR